MKTKILVPRAAVLAGPASRTAFTFPAEGGRADTEQSALGRVPDH